MAEILPEMIEQILIRLDVRELIRCKSVSKRWKSLISDPNFIKAHLQHSYRRDRKNDKLGNRRIVMSDMLSGYGYSLFAGDCIYYTTPTRHLLGSSNGLVCVSPSITEYLVVNPETREVNKLKTPQIPETLYLIYGFGHDSSKDDYKVVLGFPKVTNSTCFLMFSLKSKTWEVVGEVNYMCMSTVGVLFNGALHWVAYHDKKEVILSFDLCEDKFEEIPQPCKLATRLGIMDDCLCVYDGYMYPLDVWVMKVRPSWELVEPQGKNKTEVVHQLKELKYYISDKRSFCQEEWFVQTQELIESPLYMPSLVSPHVAGNHEKEEEAGNKEWQGDSKSHGSWE